MTMSNFWSLWIIVLFTGCIIMLLWLLLANRTVDHNEEDKKVGHNFDGIEEYDNPLPGWFFNLFLGSIIFAGIYLILFPGYGSFKGVLNWTSANAWQAEIVEAEEEFNALAKTFMATDAKTLAANRDAVKMGQRLFKANCSTCHGADAKGSYAFPNLTDNDWLYGDSEEAIKQTITNGRNGAMPGWQAALGNDLDKMTDYVIKLGNEDVNQHPMDSKFKMLCSACHQADGSGNQMLGAPNLRDDIWLYGGSPSEINITIAKGRMGHMPSFKQLLSPERIHLLTAYIYSINESKAEN
jgi:cytochrome c oxidase cbb3-type subunit 3